MVSWPCGSEPDMVNFTVTDNKDERGCSPMGAREQRFKEWARVPTT